MGSSKHNELPSGWEIKKLDEVSFIDMGQSPDSEFYNEEEIGLPLIQGNADMKNGRSIKRYFTSQITKKCNKGDFILSVRAPVGKIGIASFESCLGRGVCSIRSKSEDSNFLFQLLLSLENKWEKLEQGSTFSAISGSDIKNFKILLPPLPEQRAIANILSTWDTAIQTTQDLISQKEAEKKWLMQNLLTGKKRLKGFENTNWKNQPLENFITPISREIPKPNKSYLGIGLRSHGKGTFLKPDEQPEKNVMDKFYIVRENDLIVNITFAWEQAIAIVKKEDDGALASHRFPTYTFKEGKGNANFFKFLILLRKMKFMLEMISPGGAGRNRVMSKSDFLKLEFPIPQFEEQTAISQVLQMADKELNLLKTKLAQQKLQKKGLMQVLLTGKVRIKIENLT